MRWSAAEALSWISRQEPLDLGHWTSDMGPGLEHAQKELAEGIAAGRVDAWGRKEAEPHGLVERIPTDPFRIRDVQVVVGVHGDMTTLPAHKLHKYKGPRWRSIEFEADEIKRAWPKPPPPDAQDWMLKEATRRTSAGQVGKRDDMVRSCMEKTGCTKREALAAYGELPRGLRRPPGKPPRNSG
jgi:hypothetical protein